MASIIFYGQFTETKLGKTGLTVTANVFRVTRASSVVSQVVTALAAFEVGNGMYGYRLDNADLTLYDFVAVFQTATLTVDLQEVPSLWSIYGLLSTGNGLVAYTYTLTNSVTGLVVEGATVWCSTDLAGTNIVATSTTDVFGQVNFHLDPGTYYFWAYKPGYNLGGPDTEVVP